MVLFTVAPAAFASAQSLDGFIESFRAAQVSAPMVRDSDNELPALGRMRTDGDYSHGAPGDGLSVLDEYRGYVLDGGTNGFAAGHHRLSFSRKELLVEVSELPGLAEKGASSLNPAAATNFNSHAVMTAVADFYSNPTRGMGIDLYWATDEFDVLGPMIDPDGLPLIENAFRFTGHLSESDIQHSFLTNGTMQSMSNYALSPIIGIKSDRNAFLYQQLVRDATLYNFLRLSRNPLLSVFVKMMILDRTGDVYLTDGSQWGKVKSDNAKTFLRTRRSFEYEGAYICAVSMAEELFEDSNSIMRFYSSDELFHQMVWSFAHEFGHLIINYSGKDNWTPFGHVLDQYALMTDKRISPDIFPFVTVTQQELQAVDLRLRLSTGGH